MSISGENLRAKRLARIDELLQLLGGSKRAGEKGASQSEVCQREGCQGETIPAGVQSEISVGEGSEAGGEELAEREELLEELGGLLYAEDRIKEAQDTLYALLKINPRNATALGYIELIRSRLDFVNKDLMNP